MFPEQEFFTLNQVASQWDVELEKVHHAIMDGKLRSYFWVEKTLMHKVDHGNYMHDEMISKSLPVGGYMQLLSSDCRSLFIKGRVVVRNFFIDKTSHYRLHNYIPDFKPDHNDIVITKAEKLHFEQEYRLELNSPVVFKYSNDFREIYFENQKFILGVMQASVVKQLYEASSINTPWILGKTLLKNAGSESHIMRDIFKMQKNWRDLIKSNRKGNYRLSPKIRCEQRVL